MNKCVLCKVNKAVHCWECSMDFAGKTKKELLRELRMVSEKYNCALRSLPVLTDSEIEARVRLETINKEKFKIENASLFLFAEWHYSINNADNKTKRLKYLENVKKEFKKRFLKKEVSE